MLFVRNITLFSVGGDFKYYAGIPIPMRLRKLELETGINGLKVTSFFRVSGEGKQVILLEIKRQEQVIVSVKGNVKTPSSQGSLLQARVNLPILFDSKSEFIITENVIHISTNTLLLPSSSFPRRVKAFMDINWDNKQGQVMVLWNADQDPSQKIAVDVIIVPESPAQATIQ